MLLHGFTGEDLWFEEGCILGGSSAERQECPQAVCEIAPKVFVGYELYQKRRSVRGLYHMNVKVTDIFLFIKFIYLLKISNTRDDNIW